MAKTYVVIYHDFITEKYYKVIECESAETAAHLHQKVTTLNETIAKISRTTRMHCIDPTTNEYAVQVIKHIIETGALS